MSGIDDSTNRAPGVADTVRAARPIVCVVGARPNYMKMAPIIRALAARAAADASAPPPVLVHTGQHYDAAMNDSFFTALGMPRPAVNLEVGSASHAVQTAEIMKRFEPVVDRFDPAAVLVVGDVNSTIACALVATKKGVPVVHVEAGLRSYDRAMPEEINRVLTDQIADVLYTTERAAAVNLRAEGIADARIAFVGNVMIDTLLANRSAAVPPQTTLAGSSIAAVALGAAPRYGVVTLHRPSNVDDRATLARLFGALAEISTRLPLVLALHPRTRARIDEFGLAAGVTASRIAMLPPQGYLEMLGLMANATLVLTDSGGLQEETTALGVPCLTLRENTERPITIAEGTNTLCGTDPRRIVDAAFDVLATGGKRGRSPELWDGRAAERIAEHLAGWIAVRNAASTDGDTAASADGNLAATVDGNLAATVDGNLAATVDGNLAATVDGNLAATVDGNLAATVDGNLAATVDGNLAATVDGNLAATVDGNLAATVDGNLAATVDGNLAATVDGNLAATVDGNLAATVDGNLAATVDGNLAATVDGNLAATVDGNLAATVDGNLAATVNGNLAATVMRRAA